MDLGLVGRRALVTGASAGIGRACAVELAREGVELVLVARRGAALEELADTLEHEGLKRPSLVEQDVRLDDAVQRIVSHAGRVDILVNSAGGHRRSGLDASPEDWDDVMLLNFTRQRELGAAVVGGMRDRGWGRIVSITGKSEPSRVSGAFSAKAAMHAWSKGLSREVAARGVTVNCVAPGRIETEQMLRNYSDDERAEHAREIPVGAYGAPEDVAAMVCFLASTRARYVTGTVIAVDGGLRRYQF